jgi:PAT family beta-lactamase induction signal transducer AmpG
MIVGLIMAALTIYNYFSTPRTEDAKTKEEKSLEPKVSFELFCQFFSKTNWDRTLYIIIPLGRILTKNADPFLIDDISVGGMGLTTQDVGIYGTFGVICLNYRRNNWEL